MLDQAQPMPGVNDEPRTFALKKFFSSNAKLDYRREVAAFRKIKSSNNDTNIVKYFTSFQFKEGFYIIQELCHMNLRQYFSRERHPVTTETKIAFWKSFSKVASGVHAVNSYHQEPTPFGRVDWYSTPVFNARLIYSLNG